MKPLRLKIHYPLGNNKNLFFNKPSFIFNYIYKYHKEHLEPTMQEFLLDFRIAWQVGSEKRRLWNVN